jgi:hypothetical protein
MEVDAVSTTVSERVGKLAPASRVRSASQPSSPERRPIERAEYDVDRRAQ